MFNHIEAQNYEKKYADGVVLNDFLDLYKRWEECKKNGGLWQDQGNQWFQGDLKAWNKFVKYIKTKKCVEIGSGPFGFLAPCYWLKDRVIINNFN